MLINLTDSYDALLRWFSYNESSESLATVTLFAVGGLFILVTASISFFAWRGTFTLWLFPLWLLSLYLFSSVLSVLLLGSLIWWYFRRDEHATSLPSADA